jgi:hypothetical protein
MTVFVSNARVQGPEGLQKLRSFMKDRGFHKAQIGSFQGYIHSDNKPFLDTTIQSIGKLLKSNTFSFPLSPTTIINNLPQGAHRATIFSLGGESDLVLFKDAKDFTHNITTWNGTGLVAFGPSTPVPSSYPSTSSKVRMSGILEPRYRELLEEEIENARVLPAPTLEILDREAHFLTGPKYSRTSRELLTRSALQIIDSAERASGMEDNFVELDVDSLLSPIYGEVEDI